MHPLETLGWREYFQKALEEAGQRDALVARVVEEWPGKYVLRGESGDWDGIPSGRLKNQAVSKAQLPCVGDWVWCSRPQTGVGGGQLSRVEGVLPRRTVIKRMIPGGDEQVLASNVDFVFIVTSLNQDFNLRRLERYLSIAWESGASPVIVLNKADLCDDAEARVQEARTIAGETAVLVTSALAGEGLDPMCGALGPGVTGVFLGSSGVGKSTLVNQLRGEAVQATAEIREDDSKGRHTTTRRSLIRIPGQGMIIDTPGLREIQIRVDERSLSTTFDDVDRLAKGCRFPDCRHESEPGCAVKTALESGELTAERFASFLKLRQEVAAHQRLHDKRIAANTKRRWKSIQKSMRHKRKVDRDE